MTWIVAEIGSNHDGDLAKAYELIDAAAECGADAVKFQHYPDTSFGPVPMPQEWLGDLYDHANAKGVDFLCSVFDARTMREYLELEVGLVKVASPELVRDDLLDMIPDGYEVMLSTGMSTVPQINHAVARLRYRSTLTLLHCTSAYPPPPSEMNLRAIPTLRELYGLPVGFSDHSLDVTAPVAAVALGACVVEKHFTLARGGAGPDHFYALEPWSFRRMVGLVRETELMLGDGVKRVMDCEDPTDRRMAA